MLRLIALRRVKYPHGSAGREYAPGEGFDALSERDAKVLKAAGRAKDAPEVERPKLVEIKAPVYRTAAVTPAPTVEPETETDVPAKRQYRRRDMSAEQD